MLRYRMHRLFDEPLEIQSATGARKGDTLGSIQRASDNETPDLSFTTPRLTLRVRHESSVRAGDIVLRRGGVRYLVSHQSDTPDYRTHWLIYVDRQVVWRRQIADLEPLTGLPRATGNWTVVGNIWVSWEMVSREPFDRDLRIREEMYRVITGENIRLNDEVAGQQVRRINEVLGVKIVTVQ